MDRMAPLHARMHGFDFVGNKGRRINLFQSPKKIWPRDWHQQLKWITVASNTFNLERAHSLNYLFYEITTYLI